MDYTKNLLAGAILFVAGMFAVPKPVDPEPVAPPVIEVPDVEPASPLVDPVEIEPVKTCPCSDQCTCGCNVGDDCTCGNPSLSNPVTTQSLGSTSPEWTYPGEIRSHLASGHGVNAQGMTTREAELLHNQLHNAERSGTVQVQRASVMSSSCPGGNCPSPSRTVRRGLFGWRR